MTRTIVVYGPSALSTPSIDLVDSSDVVQDSISLTEDTNAKGRYTGSIDAGTSAGDYTGIVLTGSSAIGTFEEVTVTAEDPSTVIVRPLVNTGLDDEIASIQASITGMTITVTSLIVGSDQQINLRQSMDYNNTDGRAITFTGDAADQWPDLTGATVTLTAVQGDDTLSQTATITSPTGTQSFYFEFTATELSSTNAPTGNYRYNVIATLSSGRKVELVEEGTLSIESPFSSGEHE